MATRDELVAVVAERYTRSARKDRSRILDEFTAVSGLHRKHAMRLLRIRSEPSGPRRRRRVYDDAVREALILVWEASDRVCGKRLRPLIPILVKSMERHGHLKLAPEVGSGLLAMSAATIDRSLCKVKEQATGGGRRRSASSTGVRRSVPVRTFDGWDDPAPGFMEADLVAHSGPTAEGSFVQTLTLTDIASGWTECAPLLVREQTVLIAVLSEVRKRMPFPLLGFDTDNDSVFDKQRDAVGPGQDLLEQRCGQSLAAGERGDHRSTLPSGQLGQVQCTDMSRVATSATGTPAGG